MKYYWKIIICPMCDPGDSVTSPFSSVAFWSPGFLLFWKINPYFNIDVLVLSSVHLSWKFGICLENIYWSFEWNCCIDKCNRSTNFRLILSILFNWYNDSQTNDDFLLETFLLYWWKFFCQFYISNQFGIFMWNSIFKILDGRNWFWIWNIVKHIYSKSNSDVLASIFVNK